MTKFEFQDELVKQNEKIRDQYLHALRIWFKEFKFDRILLESPTFGTKLLRVDELDDIYLNDIPLQDVPLLQIGEFYNSLVNKISDSFTNSH